MTGHDTGRQPLLTVKDLTTTFVTPRGLASAVDEVSFSVDEGENHGIVGKPGSGKSVLVCTIMGLLPPQNSVTTGRVIYDGVDIRESGGRLAR